MNDVTTSQADALRKLVEDYRERQCREILEAAQARAREIVAEAYRNARERLHEAVVSERRRLEARVEAARVQIDTARRERERATVSRLLAQTWTQLEQQVQARWAQPQARQHWLESLVHTGLASLPRRAWTVEHPPAFEDNDRKRLDDLLTSETGNHPTFRADGDIRAGVRFLIDGACLDGTVTGILVDREAIESLLLAEVSQQ